jgi:hypothetical protein
MNDKIKVTVKKNETFLKGIESKSDKNKKWDLKVTEEKVVNFDKLEDGKESEENINLQISEAGKNSWKDVSDAKITYKENWLRKGFYIKNNLTTASETIELNNDKVDQRLSTDVHTFKLISYVVAVISLLGLGFIGWYFISSNEDKEEESL